ncbi:MAG TPA: sigma-70 family RNA polymerase sigma factor [Solirubrobacterales bacterium]|jgi:RNA polymerase sigma factor (sigma-70 family)|nr:sigma-70 family RNA polymerase sigma factor [Solirubrobacterales bacterium]
MATRPTSRRSSTERRARILEQLLATEGGLLRRQARRHAPSAADAEDAFQEGCLDFLRCYEDPSGERALGYLMVCVKHRAWAAGHQARTREAFYEVTLTDVLDEQDDVPLLRILCERPGPAERAERGEEVARFFEALAALKSAERTALLLLGLGCSYREIMERQGWSYSKLNRCLSEGRAALRALDERGR